MLCGLLRECRRLKLYRLEVAILCAYVKTRALLYPFGGGNAAVAVEVGREVTVAKEDCLGKTTLERGEEATEGVALWFGACVCSAA